MKLLELFHDIKMSSYKIIQIAVFLLYIKIEIKHKLFEIF